MMKTICILSLLAIGFALAPAAEAAVWQVPDSGCDVDVHFSTNGPVASGDVECGEFAATP